LRQTVTPGGTGREQYLYVWARPVGQAGSAADLGFAHSVPRLLALLVGPLQQRRVRKLGFRLAVQQRVGFIEDLAARLTLS
jgi:hypothetical protein